MKEHHLIFQEIHRLQQLGESYALATVVKVSGSTYRGAGARMLITQSGQTFGTISGGCLEGDVFQKAQKVIEDGAPVLIEYDTTSPDDIFWGTGMGCGGVTTVLIENPQFSGKLALMSRVNDFIQQQRPFSIATVFKNGNDAVLPQAGICQVYPEPHQSEFATDSTFTANLIEDLKAANNSGSTLVKTYSLQTTEIELLLETVIPPLPLIIFGGGHDVHSLIRLANFLGWNVTVVEYREALTTAEKFPDADQVILWEDTEPPSEMRVSERSACVIMNHHYLTDKKILKTLIPSPAHYIGFLGPAKRAKQLLEEIQAEGTVLTKSETSRLFSPVGLDIGAETAEEIALSVIGEIQASINGRPGGSLRERKGPIHER